MSIHLVSGLLAVAISLFVIMAASQGKSRSSFFVPMIIAFALFHLSEVLGLVLFGQAHTIENLIRVYYAVSLVALALISFYACEVANIRIKGFKVAAICATLFFGALCIATDIVVAGVQSINYFPTAVKGPAYLLFRVFSLGLLLVISAVLIVGYRRANSHKRQIQCIYTLYAIFPIILTCSGLLVLMALEYKINGVGVLPAASILFMVITLVSEERHQLTDIRRFVPSSSERKTSSEVMSIVSSYSRDEIQYRDAVSEIERLLVVQKYKKNSGNASATAELMGMPRSSLYSIFNRLKIDANK